MGFSSNWSVGVVPEQISINVNGVFSLHTQIIQKYTSTLNWLMVGILSADGVLSSEVDFFRWDYV